MAGTNLLGACALFTESAREEQTIIITGSIVGLLTRETEDFATDTKTHYVEKLNFKGTEGLGRIPFDGRDYYTFDKRPEPGQFYLVQTCCCKCRWEAILYNVVNRFTSEFKKATSEWKLTSTTGTDEPIEEEGTYDAKAQFSVDWGQGVITTTGKTDRPPCRNADEGNLQGVNLAVTYTPNVLVTQTDMGDATESLTPMGIDNRISGASPHFILEQDYGYVKCDGMNISLKGKWTGHGEITEPGGTVTEDIEVTNTVTLNLS